MALAPHLPQRRSIVCFSRSPLDCVVIRSEVVQLDLPRSSSTIRTMKFQVTFPHAAPIHQRASEFLSRQVPLLGREDLTLTWSDRGELLTVTDVQGNELAKAPCPPLSDSE